MPNTTPKPKTINAELIYYMFDEIKGELKEMKKDYVTKTESAALKQQIKDLQVELHETKNYLNNQIIEIKKSRNLWAWLSPTLTAIATAVVTWLIIEEFKR